MLLTEKIFGKYYKEMVLRLVWKCWNPLSLSSDIYCICTEEEGRGWGSQTLMRDMVEKVVVEDWKGKVEHLRLDKLEVADGERIEVERIEVEGS
jgi:hypothetical protein